MFGWVAASSYALSAPAPTLVCVTAGAPVPLAAYPVSIPLRTADAIDAGALAADCSDLWVSDDQLQPVPFWLEDCGAVEAHLWAAVDVDPAAPPVTLLVHTTGTPGLSSADGAAVFPLLFDDFDDRGRFGANWREIGTGDGVLDGGRYESQGVKALVSAGTPLSADDSELVVAIDAAGGWDDDVEIGGGDMDADGSSDYLWHGSRRWYGFSHVTYLDAYYDAISGTTPVPVGGCVSDWYAGEWLPETSQGADPRRVTVTYDRAGGSRLDTDAGVSLTRTVGGAGCAAASPLPALLVLDHASGGANPTQHLDYVFVRPRVTPEPAAAIVDGDGDGDGDGVPSWQEGCGDADVDGVPDYADPDPTAPTGSTTSEPTANTTTPGSATTTPPVSTSASGSPSTTDPTAGSGTGTGAGTDRGAASAGASATEIGCGCAHASGPAGWAALALAAAGASAARRPAGRRRG